jgi:isocitrate dehydrogenase kinase/phosphatase
METGVPEETNQAVRTEALQCLKSGYRVYRADFDVITQRAVDRFSQRDWAGMRRDTLARLDIYEQVGRQVQSQLSKLLGPIRDKAFWRDLKADYGQAFVRQRCDVELARTFFNSVQRRIFKTQGIDPETEFVDTPDPTVVCGHPPPLDLYTGETVDAAFIQGILESYPQTPLRNPQEDARRCALRILERYGTGAETVHVEMLRMPFFRDMNAYLIGRMHVGGRCFPLVFALGSSDRGIFVDALLLTTEQLRILFSFSRAYFHVQSHCPSALVRFLKELMPPKRLAELYIGLGFHKHGKTELYRDLLKHREVCGLDRFDTAVGQPGMVMVAFYMPQDDLIYKVIRDRFASPKQTTRYQVMQKYDYVFKHDRAGRLVDVQTFEHLQIDHCCFTEQLLAELRQAAGHSIEFRDGQVLLHHVYVERRVTPLDVYLQHADPARTRAAIIDYGQAIKDLARINVFAGDLLIKNFGVTSLGRVVFYDYDELCPLTECNFRVMPRAVREEDALSDEPWFMIGPSDVFPEEFATFLGLDADMLAIFRQYHGDLLTTEFWRRTQELIRAGHWTPIRPYAESDRLGAS